MDQPYVRNLGSGVHAYVQPDGGWWINNAGFVSADGATVVVDTCATEGRARRFQAAIGETRPHDPVRAVVNTHHHGDHTYGNFVFDDAVVVGTQPCRESAENAGINRYEALFEQPDWGDLRLVLPSVTFERSTTLWVGDTRIELHAYGEPAHTESDTVVWVPDAGVVFTGDLVFDGGMPFVAFGSVGGWLRALAWLRSFDATTVVPGHGPVGDPAALDRVEAYLQFLAQLAADAVAAGHSPLEAASRADLGPFASLLDSERLVANLHRAMWEASGAPPDSPPEVGAMITDMLAMRDGARVPCRA